jgi:hypothetical protein
MHELNIHKIRPEKSDQAIEPELQVTVLIEFYNAWYYIIIKFT